MKFPILIVCNNTGKPFVFTEINPYFEDFVLTYLRVDITGIQGGLNYTQCSLKRTNMCSLTGWDQPSIIFSIPVHELEIIDWDQFTNDLEECFISNRWHITAYPKG